MYCFRHLASFTRNLWLSTQVMNVYMWWLESSWICHSFYFLSDITDVCPRSWHKTRSQLFLLIPSFQHKMRSVEKWHLFVVFFVIYSSVFPFFLKTRFYSYEKNALLTLVLNLSHLISLAVLIIPPATNDRWQFFVTLWFQNHCNYINGKAYALITLT